MKVLVNDKLVDRSKAAVDIEDRGYQFGDGVYEVIRLYNKKFFTFEEHIDRLFASAAKIELGIPYSKEKLRELLENLVKENDIDTGNVYLQVSRGVQQPRNHIIPDDLALVGILTASAQEVPRNPHLFEDGGTAIIEPDTRWLHCDIKSISLLGNVLAKNRAHRAGAMEAILHRDGEVTECSASNVYMIKDGEVFTHPADNLILNGITRQGILKAIRANGIPVKEEAFTIKDLKEADEVFISSVTLEVTPITAIDGVPVGEGKRGAITAKIHEHFVDLIVEQCGELETVPEQ